jgi:hypothetical protein
MTSSLRHLLVFDATLQDDPYLCWLYAAQFVATAKVEASSVGFMPMFPYGGPDPSRLGIERVCYASAEPWRKRRRILEKLGFKEQPSVTLTTLTAGKKHLTRLVDQDGARLASVILFGNAPADAAELVKLVHVGTRDIAPAMVAVVRRLRLTEIVDAGLRELGVPLYMDIGFEHGEALSLPAGFAGAFSFWSDVEYPLPAQRGPEADWSSIRAGASPRPRAPVVLFLRPDWSNCGSFTTFKGIALRYARRGTIILDIALDARRRKYSIAEAAERIDVSRHEFSPAFTCVATRSRTWATRRAHRSSDPSGLVAEHVARYAQVAAPPWLRDLVHASRADYAYVNHYFTLEYLKCLQLDIPLMLDTHDIQSVNYIHHKFSSKRKARSELFSELFEQEIAYFRRAKSVAFVNADELELVEAKMPSVDLFHYIAIPTIEPSAVGSFASTGETGPQWRRDGAAPAADDARRLHPRLLIVSSQNPGNAANIDWFLQHVWPQIEETGATLDLVGTISIHVAGKALPESWAVHGHVPSLGDFYARADVVVLPIVKGGGVAIKTIEGLLHGRPICGTSHAFRGLGKPVQALFPKVDDAAAFAAELQRLLQDPAAAQQRMAACRQAAAYLSPERFEAAFDKRHQAMLEGAAERSGVRSPSATCTNRPAASPARTTGRWRPA